MDKFSKAVMWNLLADSYIGDLVRDTADQLGVVEGEMLRVAQASKEPVEVVKGWFKLYREQGAGQVMSMVGAARQFRKYYARHRKFPGQN